MASPPWIHPCGCQQSHGLKAGKRDRHGSSFKEHDLVAPGGAGLLDLVRLVAVEICRIPSPAEEPGRGFRIQESTRQVNLLLAWKHGVVELTDHERESEATEPPHGPIQHAGSHGELTLRGSRHVIKRVPLEGEELEIIALTQMFQFASEISDPPPLVKAVGGIVSLDISRHKTGSPHHGIGNLGPDRSRTLCVEGSKITGINPLSVGLLAKFPPSHGISRLARITGKGRPVFGSVVEYRDRKHGREPTGDPRMEDPINAGLLDLRITVAGAMPWIG